MERMWKEGVVGTHYESVFWNGGNNLHIAAACSKHNLGTLRILINRMTLDLINQEDADGFTRWIVRILKILVL